MGDIPGCNSIQKSTSLCGGNPSSSSEKTSSYSQLPEAYLNLVLPRPSGKAFKPTYQLSVPSRVVHGLG